MSFIDQMAFGDAPKRVCPDKLGSLIQAFPPGVLTGHERAGYIFRGQPCIDAIAYDPDFCVPGDLKMDPGAYPPGTEATLGMLQTAINCPLGVELDELREEARLSLSYQIDRAIDADLTAYLAALAVAGPAGSALCTLAEAGQYLATSGQCGRGIIFGPVRWFIQLVDALIWNGKYHTDYVGNIVIASSVDSNQVFAFDPAIEIKISEVQILDELSPGIRTVNDKVVRAEQLYSIAVDTCSVGSFTVNPCT